MAPDNRPEINKQEWAAFEEAAAERLQAIESRYADSSKPIDLVEDVEIEVETDTDYDDIPRSNVYLTLEGDLVTSMLRYHVCHDEEDPNYNKLKVRLDGYSVDKLREQLTRGDW